MTFAAEIAKVNPNFTVFLCIEGVGWPTDESDLSQGFDGTVFSVGTLGGTLATTLGCTVIDRLHPPTGFSDKINPLSYAYSAGGMTYKITEAEDDTIMSSIFRPNVPGNEGVLQQGLIWTDTEPRIDNDDVTWSNGDVIWVGGSEAILLAGRTLVGGTVYKYTGSTRGYLGTIQGRRSGVPRGTPGFEWATGQKIQSWNRYWWNRRVHLYFLAKDDTVGQATLLSVSRFRNAKQEEYGTSWSLVTVSSDRGDGGGATSVRERPSEQVLEDNVLIHKSRTFPQRDLLNALRICYFNYQQAHSSSAWEKLALAFTYDYRNRVSGGTAGAYTAAIAGTPQAPLENGRYRNFSVFDIDGHFLRGIGSAKEVSYSHFRTLALQAINMGWHSGVLSDAIGAWDDQLFPKNTPVAFALELVAEASFPAARSWFTVNNTIRTNILDLALIFMTSMDDEFHIFDADGAGGGSTTTTIVRQSGSFTVDEWNGYALHCVEGDNEGEARVISDTTASAIVVDEPFSNVPSAGDEYQVRNTIYDVLPIGWGMQYHHTRVDIQTFETFRDRYYSNEHANSVLITAKGKFNVHSFVTKNLLSPFGLALIQDRLTAKHTLKMIEMGVQDGLFENFETIEADEILSVSRIDHIPSKAVGTINLNVRGKANVIRMEFPPPDPRYPLSLPDPIGYVSEPTGIQPSASSRPFTIPIRDEDLSSHFGEDDLATLSYDAMFHTFDDAASIVARMRARILRTATHSPQVKVKCTFDVARRIGTGDTIALTDTTVHNPPDPYLGTRGWNGRLAIVLSTNLQPYADEPYVEYALQLWPTENYTRIAPSALVVSKGSDANGDYFTIDIDGMADPSSAVEDWDNFAVGDYIALYNADGTLVSNAFGGPADYDTIKGFGANADADPDTANPATPSIYIDGTISASITAGDYITFYHWDTAAANTNNMNVHAALSDANDLLGPNDDDPTLYL